MSATVKQAMDIFTRWIHWQRIYQHRDLTTFIQYANTHYWEHLLSACEQNDQLSINVSKMFGLGGSPGFHLQSHFLEDGGERLAIILSNLENQFPRFIDHLWDNHFSDQLVCESEAAQPVVDTLNRYVDLCRALFYHPDSFIQNEYLFSLANKTFNFCFDEGSYSILMRILNNSAYYPLGRYLQSILWQFLSSEGWRDWHVDALDTLRQRAQAGTTIRYVAGGTDIYQLLTNGIYQIEVIDPLLPSQATDGFYSEGWLWLVESGEIGDILQIDHTLFLRRDQCESFLPFEAKTASGQIITLMASETRWGVYRQDTQTKCGQVLFKRRFCTQSDFVQEPGYLLLTSFNELYLLSAPDYSDGWGINANLLADDMPIAVKQLRNPIRGETLKRLSAANDVQFRFINLGGCAT